MNVLVTNHSQRFKERCDCVVILVVVVGSFDNRSGKSVRLNVGFAIFRLHLLFVMEEKESVPDRSDG